MKLVSIGQGAHNLCLDSRTIFDRGQLNMPLTISQHIVHAMFWQKLIGAMPPSRQQGQMPMLSCVPAIHGPLLLSLLPPPPQRIIVLCVINTRRTWTQVIYIALINIVPTCPSRRSRKLSFGRHSLRKC
jgi:hypothetical protein